MALFEESGSSPLHELGATQAREATSSAARFLQGPKVDVAHVEDAFVEWDHGKIPIRIYHPAPGQRRPLILYVHGGGWVTGDLEVVDGPCRRLSEVTGCVVVSVDYRLSPESREPGALHELQECVRWCDAHRQDLGAEGERMVLVGDSAGGYLIAAYVASARASPVTGVILMYPPIIRPGVRGYGSKREFRANPILSSETMMWFWDQYRGEAEAYVDLSVAANLERFPRTLFISAGIDVLRKEGLELCGRLRESGVDVHLIDYPGLAHGFFWMDRFIPEAISVVEVMSDFVNPWEDDIAHFTRLHSRATVTTGEQ